MFPIWAPKRHLNILTTTFSLSGCRHPPYSYSSKSSLLKSISFQLRGKDVMWDHVKSLTRVQIDLLFFCPLMLLFHYNMPLDWSYTVCPHWDHVGFFRTLHLPLASTQLPERSVPQSLEVWGRKWPAYSSQGLVSYLFKNGCDVSLLQLLVASSGFIWLQITAMTFQICPFIMHGTLFPQSLSWGSETWEIC